MAPRTKTGFNMRNSFTLLPFGGYRHLPFDKVIGDGWTTEVDTSFTSYAFGYIHL
jgi:hypothetical protein